MTLVGSGLQFIQPGLIGGGAAAAGPEINASAGDSVGVGIFARTVGTDIAWPNTYNYRGSNDPPSVGQVLPYDQAITPTGTSYLSLYEYTNKQLKADTTQDQYMIPHNWNGTRMMGSGATWAVGGSDYNNAITRYNAGITYIRANAAPTATMKRLFVNLGTNDSGLAAGTFTQAQAETAISAFISGMRAGIKTTGTGGSTAIGTALMIIFVQPVPENISANNVTGCAKQWVEALRKIVATTVNCRLLIPAEGDTNGDNQHLTNAACRVEGPNAATLTSDATPCVITSSSGFSIYAGQKLSYAITTDKYAYPVLTGADASKFETYFIQETTDSNILTSRWQYAIRFVGDGTKTYPADDANADNTYDVTLNMVAANGVTTSKALSFPLLAAYGTQTGTIGYTPATAALWNGAGQGALTNKFTNVALPAGMLMIKLTRKSGDVITQLTIDGITVNRHAASNAAQSLFLVPIASARTTNIKTDGSTFAYLVHISAVTNTVATPTDVQAISQVNANPRSINFNVPSNGIGIGIVQEDAVIQSPTANLTITRFGTGVYFNGDYTMIRNTTGATEATGWSVPNSQEVEAFFASWAKA